MTITVNTKAFDIHASERDVVNFKNYAATSGAETLGFKRTEPKPQKDFAGMEKGEIKLTLKGPAGEVLAVYTLSTSIRADQTSSFKLGGFATLLAAAADASAEALVSENRLPYAG